MPISPGNGIRRCRAWAAAVVFGLMVRPPPAAGEEIPWNVVQQIKAAYINNMPDDLSCVLRTVFLSGEDRDGFHVSYRVPAVRMLWKKPNRMKLSFLDRDPRGNTYFEARIEPFFARLKKVQAINELNVSLFDIFFAVLEGDMNAKVLGAEKIGGREATLVHFPSVFAPLPMGATGNGLKLWVDGQNGLPLQVRFFTNRGVFTFAAEYADQKDNAGKTHRLPAKVVFTPDLTEKRRSAAFPITIAFTDYKINSGLSDAEFE